MKRIITILTITLYLLTGCTGNKQQSDEIVTVDVTASYPKKELILQDFMDVEYVPLETTDEFLTQGSVQTVGTNLIIVKNYTGDGDIFIFDRSGKGIKKINRKGQGRGEYTGIADVALDEDKNEMFVGDYASGKILVYDLDGNFKRSLKHKEDVIYDAIYNFDQDNLICHDSYLNNDGEANKRSLIIISKQDGSLTREIQIPFKEKILTMVRIHDANNEIYSARPTSDYSIIPSFGNWALVESSADTIYTYSPNHTMTPFMVRTPSIESMNPEIFLFVDVLTDRYYFMETIKKEFDFEKQKGLPRMPLLYDRQEKNISEYTVYNDDYLTKRQVNMNSKPISSEIATWQPLQAPQLVEAYGNGALKGRLKEIAAELDEESNPVIMLIKHKK